MTKGDIINNAYAKLRISGLTSQPTPEDISIAMMRLDGLAAMLSGRNICTGYNFEEYPDFNSNSGLNTGEEESYSAVLAFYLSGYFGKTPSPSLALEHQVACSYLTSTTARIERTPYPRRQPIGSGNRWPRRYRNFYPPIVDAQNECETKRMVIGDVQDFSENYSDYLTNNGETIASYTITATGGLEIVSDSLSNPLINYRIKAVGDSGTNVITVYYIKIIAATSLGRIDTRVINFELTSVDYV